MNTISPERRLKSRIQIDGRMTYRLENSNDTHEGELEDLSNQGARIWIEQELPSASQLFCRIEADDPEEPAIEFTACLLHAHPEQRESMYGYGCTIEEFEQPA